LALPYRKAVHSKIILTRQLILQLISVIEKINMPHKCCVPNCKSNYASSKLSYISVFRFPSKKIRMQEWMQILELENWRVNKTSVVCENHFKLTDMTGTERKRLIATAKPLSAHDVQGRLLWVGR
jgi:hypothetical protein